MNASRILTAAEPARGTSGTPAASGNLLRKPSPQDDGETATSFTPGLTGAAPASADKERTARYQPLGDPDPVPHERPVMPETITVNIVPR